MKRLCLQSTSMFKIFLTFLVIGFILSVYPLGAEVFAIERGGIIKVALPGSVKTFDPQKPVGAESYGATFHIFSALTRLDTSLRAVPELAKSWEHSPDVKTWTFHLNEKATFHNGRPLTAEDVIFSLERTLDPKKCPRGYKTLGPISEFIAKDKHTVVIKLSKPYLDLPSNLAGIFPRVVAKENINEINTKPIGSGPFKLKKWEMGGVTVLDRNENYFNTGFDGEPIPYIDELWLIPIKDNTSQLSALKSGAVDVIWQLSFDLFDSAKEDENIDAISMRAAGWHPIVMNLDPVIGPGQDTEKRRIFRNKDLREAMSYIIDRKAALQFAVGGHGTIADDQPIPSWFPNGPSEIRAKEQNIPLAKKLLAKAGIKPGTHFTLYTSPGRAGMQELAVVFKQMAKKADIVIDLKVVDISRYWTDIDYKEPFFVGNWGGRQNIYTAFNNFYRTGASNNNAHLSDPAVDLLLDAAGNEVNQERRQKLYETAQFLVSDSCVNIIPYHKNYAWAKGKNLMDFPITPMSYYWADRAWKKK